MNYKKINDIELVEGILKDLPYAYKAIYYNRTNQLRLYLTKQGASEYQINEIEQDTVIAFYENLVSGRYTYDGKAKISTYLYSVARFKWLKLNRIGKELPINIDAEIPDIYEEEQENTNDELLKLVMLCMDDLTELCRKTLIEYHYENKSFEEISLSIPGSTADNLRKNKTKCMKKLRNLIKENIT